MNHEQRKLVTNILLFYSTGMWSSTGIIALQWLSGTLSTEKVDFAATLIIFILGFIPGVLAYKLNGAKRKWI